MSFPKNLLKTLYLEQSKSVSQIADILKCSPNEIDYWISKYKIPKRSISEAIYVKNNPNGDPFSFTKPSDRGRSFIYGLGLGLYWGEGTKRNLNSVRLGNSDPKLIKTFIRFLVEIFNINKNKLRFGLQVFDDLDNEKVLNFWQTELNASSTQFYKVTKTKLRGAGTYKNKAKYGVLTIYFNNKKLRDILCLEIEKLRRL